MTFTTMSYQAEASKKILAEANFVARKLGLDEPLPITSNNIHGGFICPYGFAIRDGKLGWIATTNYTYGVGQSNCFTDLDLADLVNKCNRYRHEYQIPVRNFDTNDPLKVALKALKALSIDIRALSHDCTVDVEADRYWNDLEHSSLTNRATFVPIYDVYWLSAMNRDSGFGDVIYVQVFLPSRKVLALHIRDTKYISRKPIVFEGIDRLLERKNRLDK